MGGVMCASRKVPIAFGSLELPYEGALCTGLFVYSCRPSFPSFVFFF